MNKRTRYLTIIWAGAVIVFTLTDVYAQASGIKVWAADPLVKIFRDAKPNGEQQAHTDVAR